MGGGGLDAWGATPLRVLLRRQLDRHGHRNTDAAGCAAKLADARGPATKASLLADLGGFRYLDGDISGAIASWRQVMVSGHAAPAARALLNLGMLYEQLDQPTRAHELFSSAADWQVAPYRNRAMLGRIRCLDALGDGEQAVRCAQGLVGDVVDGTPEDLGAALLALAITHERANAAADATEVHRRSVALGVEPFSSLSADSLRRLQAEVVDLASGGPSAGPDIAEPVVDGRASVHEAPAVSVDVPASLDVPIAVAQIAPVEHADPTEGGAVPAARDMSDARGTSHEDRVDPPDMSVGHATSIEPQDVGETAETPAGRGSAAVALDVPVAPDLSDEPRESADGVDAGRTSRAVAPHADIEVTRPESPEAPTVTAEPRRSGDSESWPGPIDDPFDRAQQLVADERLDEAIDALEPMLTSPYLVDRCRAAYDLAVLYLNHAMIQPAQVMLETVRASGEPIWAPRATLVLGDAMHASGDRRAANALWADAADLADDAWLGVRAEERLGQSEAVVARSLVAEHSWALPDQVDDSTVSASSTDRSTSLWAARPTTKVDKPAGDSGLVWIDDPEPVEAPLPPVDTLVATTLEVPAGVTGSGSVAPIHSHESAPPDEVAAPEPAAASLDTGPIDEPVVVLGAGVDDTEAVLDLTDGSHRAPEVISLRSRTRSDESTSVAASMVEDPPPAVVPEPRVEPRDTEPVRQISLRARRKSEARPATVIDTESPAAVPSRPRAPRGGPTASTGTSGQSGERAVATSGRSAKVVDLRSRRKGRGAPRNPYAELAPNFRAEPLLDEQPVGD